MTSTNKQKEELTGDELADLDMTKEEAKAFLESPEGQTALRYYRKLQWLNEKVAHHTFNPPTGDLAPTTVEEMMVDFVVNLLHPEAGHSLQVLRPIVMQAMEERGYKLVKKPRTISIKCSWYLQAPAKPKTESVH